MTRKIFISYRRADSAYAAGRLYDRLSAHFGEENIFMDVEGLDPGVDFVETIEVAVGSCDVLIALIGPQWLTVTTDKGQRRLDNPEDFVRLEIAAALEREIRVIPILVQGARMPDSRELPQVLQRLSRFNALAIRHERFNADADRLVRAIETYLKDDAKLQDLGISERETREQVEREQILKETAGQETQIADLQKVPKKLTKPRLDPKQTSSSFLQTLPHWVLWGVGCLGLVIVVTLTIWGGKTLLTSLRSTNMPQPETTKPVAEVISKTPQPTRTTTISETVSHTDTLHPATEKATRQSTTTQTPSPEDTSTPVPTITPTLTPTELPTLTIDNYGVLMVFVPKGSFKMGSDADDALAECQKFGSNCERSWFEDEEPVHTVTLGDFYIDKYEVAKGQFAVFLSDQGNQNDGGVSWLDVSDEDVHIHYSGEIWQVDDGYKNHPVTFVTWYGAQAYCQWRGARLPTEAEWERAARGGLDDRQYPWGDDAPKCSKANYHDFDNGCGGDANVVGSYAPNGYGLYDMAGNVWEWVADWYDVYPGGDPEANDFLGGERFRVMRGGSWGNKEIYLRVAVRNVGIPSQPNDLVGFRCARSP